MRPFDVGIFDLDEALWNPIEGILAAWNKGFTAHRLTPFITKSHVEYWVGLLLPDIASYLLPDMPEDKQLQLAMDCILLENKYLAQYRGIIYPGVSETLAKMASEYALAIVSNCEDGYIEGFFAAHGLGEYFVDYEPSGRTRLDKAENIKLIIERNHWQRAVYIGDKQIDYEAACSVGIPFIHANYGFGRLDGVTNMNSFTELPQLLQCFTF